MWIGPVELVELVGSARTVVDSDVDSVVPGVASAVQLVAARNARRHITSPPRR